MREGVKRPHKTKLLFSMQHNVPLMVSNKYRWLCFRTLFALPSVSAMTHLLNVSQTKITETREEKLLSVCRTIKNWVTVNHPLFTLEVSNLHSVCVEKISILSITVFELLTYMKTNLFSPNQGCSRQSYENHNFSGAFQARF